MHGNQRPCEDSIGSLVGSKDRRIWKQMLYYVVAV